MLGSWETDRWLKLFWMSCTGLEWSIVKETKEVVVTDGDG